MSFAQLANKLKVRVLSWETKFLELDEKQTTICRNGQNRTIKQIVGHMHDSASNNTHRVVQLQYNKSPLEFPNYATYGNNDKWIAIQNYENENWEDLIQLWKSSHFHFIHVIQNIDQKKLDVQWIADKNQLVSLKEMVDDFPRHFELHIAEIEKLLKLQQ